MAEKAPFGLALIIAAVVANCQPSEGSQPPAWPERPPPPLPEAGSSSPQTPESRAGGAAQQSPSGGNSLAARYSDRPAIATFTGEATYYSDALSGRSTASGEPYRPNLFTAAHKKLKFGTVVRVVRTDTGHSTYAKVNDRGPFGSSKRIIDLSRAAATDLEMLRAGVVPVRVEVVYAP